MYKAPQITSFILLTIFISLYTPTSKSQNYNCSNTYSCGHNLQRIGYPFSGRARHPECGLAGFELYCGEQENITTILINSLTYRVLDINPSGRTITLAGNEENVCPRQSVVAPLNDTLFGYSSDDVQFLNLQYSCPPISSIPIPARNIIRCYGDGNNYTSGYYFNQIPSEICPIHVRVPVNRTFLQEFEESDSLSLRELIGRGVRVEYKYDERACLECEESGRVCWSGTNTSGKSCLCKDGSADCLENLIDAGVEEKSQRKKERGRGKKTQHTILIF